MNALAIKKMAQLYSLKRQKILCDFENISKQKMIFTEENQTKYWPEKTCHVSR